MLGGYGVLSVMGTIKQGEKLGDSRSREHGVIYFYFISL